MDRGAWPFVVGGIVCLVTSVSVCTERERETTEKEETRNKKQEREREKSRLLAGLLTDISFFILLIAGLLTDKIDVYDFPSRNRHFFFHTTRLIHGNLNEKWPA